MQPSFGGEVGRAATLRRCTKLQRRHLAGLARQVRRRPKSRSGETMAVRMRIAEWPTSDTLRRSPCPYPCPCPAIATRMPRGSGDDCDDGPCTHCSRPWRLWQGRAQPNPPILGAEVGRLGG